MARQTGSGGTYEGTVGQRITQARLAAGWTKQKLEERAKVSKGLLSRYEADDQRPKPETIRAIARALLVRPEDLDPTIPGSGDRPATKQHAWPAPIGERVAFARSQNLDQARIDMFLARVVLLHEPTEKEVDEAWHESGRRWAQFVGELPKNPTPPKGTRPVRRPRA